MNERTFEIAGRTYENAAALKTRLGISEFAIRTYVRQGMPSPIRFGGRRLFDTAKVDEWIVNQNT